MKDQDVHKQEKVRTRDFAKETQEMIVIAEAKAKE